MNSDPTNLVPKERTHKSKERSPNKETGNRTSPTAADNQTHLRRLSRKQSRDRIIAPRLPPPTEPNLKLSGNEKVLVFPSNQDSSLVGRVIPDGIAQFQMEAPSASVPIEGESTVLEMNPIQQQKQKHEHQKQEANANIRFIEAGTNRNHITLQQQKGAKPKSIKSNKSFKSKRQNQQQQQGISNNNNKINTKLSKTNITTNVTVTTTTTTNTNINTNITAANTTTTNRTNRCDSKERDNVRIRGSRTKLKSGGVSNKNINRKSSDSNNRIKRRSSSGESKKSTRKGSREATQHHQ